MAVSHVSVVNTIASGSFGGITTMVTRRVLDIIANMRNKNEDKLPLTWSLQNCINGGLTGTVRDM